MPKVTDLTGVTLPPDDSPTWKIDGPGPTIARVRHWMAVHLDCMTPLDVPHTVVMRAREGKGSMPGCPTCASPTDAGISVGMHSAPGDPPHLVGTPCVLPAGDRFGPGWAERAVATLGPVRGQGRPVAVADESAPLGWSITEVLDDLPLRFAEPNASKPDPTDWTEPRLVPPSTARAGFQFAEPVASTPDPTVSATPRAQLVGPLSGDNVTGEPIAGKAEALEGAQDLIEVIRDAVTSPAKAATGNAGMSSLGGCERKLGYRLLLGRPAGRPALRPAVGTAAHAWLEEVFREDNDRMVEQARDVCGEPVAGRWVLSTKLTKPARGITDLYDRWHGGRVIDFKFQGITALRRMWRGDVDDTYQVQLDLYGLGMSLLGYPVATVALLGLPAAGELADAAWFERPWNRDNALAAIARRDRINAMGSVAEPARVLSVLSTTADHCDYCPVLAAGMCAGVDVKKTEAPIMGVGFTSTVAPPPGVAFAPPGGDK